VLEAVHTSKDPTAFAVVPEDGAALRGLTMAAAGLLLSHFRDRPPTTAARRSAPACCWPPWLVLGYESRELW